MNKIKILMLVDNLNKCDGIASYVMNYYQKMDHEKYSIDFLVSKYNDNVANEYRKLIKKNNDKIILKNNISNKSIIKELKNIDVFFKKNNYDIIHSHIINMGYFYLKYARKNGVKIRILHSHSTFLWSKNIIKFIRNKIFTRLALKNSNVYFACSNMAGKFLFKNKKFYLIKNAIEFNKFAYNVEIRDKYRKELKLDGKVVYGHVGRFNIQKNHTFLLDVFEKIVKNDDNSILLLIGKGELENEILQIVKNKKLENHVKFLGERDDVNNLFQAMDLFLLPSLFEGLPVVGVEAQASDLQCIFSDKITKEVRLLDKTIFIDINNSDNWVNAISKLNVMVDERKNVNDIIRKNGYDIQYSTKILDNIYESLIIGEKNEI